MPPYDPNLLKRLEYLRLAWQRRGVRWLAPAVGRLPGGQCAPADHRDYAPGDPLWHVDWNLCARSDELLTRQFWGEADAHVYLLLDCSRSMSLGEPSRFEAACRYAAALGYWGLASGWRVGAAGFAHRIVDQTPLLCGRARVGRLLGFLASLAPAHAPTDLAGAAAEFVRRRQRGGPIVVLSDMHAGGGLRQGLDILRLSGYAPRVLWIDDSREPSPLGDVELFDVESGAARQVTLTESDLLRYRRRWAAFAEGLRRFCAGRGIPCARIPADLPETALERVWP